MEILKWGGRHICCFLLISILYIITFRIKFLSVTGIYFYDGIIRLVVTAIIALLVIYLAKKRLGFDYKDVCLALCAGILCNMIWFSLCIVSLDRSLSVFLLCYIDQEGQISESSMEYVFQDVFVEEYEMLGRRYNEQVESGNIIINDGYISLTKRGEEFVRIFKNIGTLYNVDDRFINPSEEK